MSYFDDLKKKVQNAYNAGKNIVENATNAYNSAVNTATNAYNAAKEGVQNVHNAITGQNPTNNTPAPQNAPTQAQNTPATAPTTSQPAQTTPTTDWLAEYDKAMQSNPANTGATSQGEQTAQTSVSPAAQATLGEGASRWQADLDKVMAEIMGQGKFEYDMNGDAMYQQYADMFQNNANLAMQNSMAQAAAMSGGYGSSYAQQVGQQAYAQQMQGLNDIGLELYDRAYAQDQAERSRLMDQYNMIAARDEQAYNRAVAERNFEYQKYLDELDQGNFDKQFEYQKDRDEVADSQWQQSFDYNKYLDELEQSNYEKEFDYRTERDAVSDSQRQAELDRMLANDEISQQQWQAEMDRATANDKLAAEQWQSEYDRAVANDALAAEQWNKQYTSSEEQRALDNAYRDSAFEYQKTQDQQAQTNWQAELDRMLANDEISQQQWQAEMDRATANDARAEEEFDRLYGYTDEEGNHVDGYYDRAREDEQNWQAEEWDKMYGENGYQTNRDAIEDERYNAALEASNPVTKYEGAGALNGQNVPKEIANVPGLTTTNTDFFNADGTFKSAAIVSVDKDTVKNELGVEKAGDASKDVITYNLGGKEITLRRGYSPYTNTKNPDAKNGTFNGYQPDNVASFYGGNATEGKLTKVTGNDVIVNGQPVTDAVVNGRSVPIYKTSDGMLWVYDAANNEYFEPDIEVDKKDNKQPTNTTSKTNNSNKGSGRPGGSLGTSVSIK